MVIIKTVKVTDKGQISLPLVVREAAGIERGDELIIVQDDGKIMIEKASNLTSKIQDDFSDILKHSEESLREVWDNPEDDIWASYLE